MVGIQIISDLHLESPMAYDIYDVPAKAPYLALLGDIGYTKHREEYLGFLRRHLSKFRVVFLVLGNHEPWHTTWKDCKQTIRQFEQEMRLERDKDGSLGELVLLDQTRYEMDDPSVEGVVILGCTLFSRVPAASMEAVSFGVNDFYNTEDWTVEQHNAEFERDLKWLNEQVTSLDRTKKQAIILTHYSPTLDERAVDPRHRHSPIQSNFATVVRDQPCWLSDRVKLWAFGHTHYNCDFAEEKTGKLVITNQRGYYFNQSEKFLEGKVVEIP